LFGWSSCPKPFQSATKKLNPAKKAGQRHLTCYDCLPNATMELFALIVNIGYLAFDRQYLE
jgi:hypothetical protein